MVMPRDEPEVVSRVNDLRIFGIRRDPPRLATSDGVPVRYADTEIGRAARDSDRRVVLLRAVQPIREPVVGRDAIELSRRLIVLRGPGPTAVERDRRAAVVAEDHSVRIVRVDPEIVVVAMRNG